MSEVIWTLFYLCDDSYCSVMNCFKSRGFCLCFPTTEPSFVSMAQMPESENNEAGDDDKVYLFFSEKAVECDCFNKIVVSRVARVCKVIKSVTLFLSLPPFTTIAHKQWFPWQALFRHFKGIRFSCVAVSVSHREILEVRGLCKRSGHPS